MGEPPRRFIELDVGRVQLLNFVDGADAQCGVVRERQRVRVALRVQLAHVVHLLQVHI